MQSFSKSNLPTGDWFVARKRVSTRFIEIQGPFQVVTQEGEMTCEDGFLAVDEAGYPYPVARDIFFRSYDTSNIVGLKGSQMRDHEKIEEAIDEITHSRVVDRGVPATASWLAALNLNETINAVERFLKTLKELAGDGTTGSEGVSGDPAGGGDSFPDTRSER